jgi:hypothetical protein
MRDTSVLQRGADAGGDQQIQQGFHEPSLIRE